MAERNIPWRVATEERRFDFIVRALNDRDEIRKLLAGRIEYTAYALGQLEPGLFERTHWFRAQGETGSALVLHSRGGLGDATFVMGEANAAAAILSIHPGPAQTYVTCQPHHLDPLQRVYRLAHKQPMIRMAVTRETFVPVSRVATVPLAGVDIRRINALYGTDGSASYYTPEHIESGLYRGVVDDGRLVAIAGTHVVSQQERVAVVGNVFTHPLHRGKGYATATTSAVTAALLEFCDTVVLTVDPRNTPAVAAYYRLGYREACQLVEASATRRDPAGIGAFARRVRAAIRGRRYHGSFVTIRG
ncbi:MAG: hypothetical protein Kow0010_19870 [Dehalococcoidia bacterium]